MRPAVLLALAAAISSSSSELGAQTRERGQPGQPGQRGQQGQERPRAERSRQTNKSEPLGPAPGELVPDASVIDGEGNTHSIRDLLKGHTTAIVFGCLT